MTGVGRATRPFGLLATQTGHPDFPEAAAQARGPSASFAASKLPLVIAHTRPQADRRQTCYKAAGHSGKYPPAEPRGH